MFAREMSGAEVGAIMVCRTRYCPMSIGCAGEEMALGDMGQTIGRLAMREH